jgi:hypothetical protein
MYEEFNIDFPMKLIGSKKIIKQLVNIIMQKIISKTIFEILTSFLLFVGGAYSFSSNFLVSLLKKDLKSFNMTTKRRTHRRGITISIIKSKVPIKSSISIYMFVSNGICKVHDIRKISSLSPDTNLMLI